MKRLEDKEKTSYLWRVHFCTGLMEVLAENILYDATIYRTDDESALRTRSKRYGGHFNPR